MLLWVDGDLVAFDGPTTYTPDESVTPHWSPEDPGDLEPAGIGAQGLALSVSRLRLYRDVYYVATSSKTGTDYDYERAYSPQDILQVMCTPQLWSQTSLFEDRRRNVEFNLGEDQFFPMGDNSPQSRDARVWSRMDGRTPEPPPAYVRRDLLTGKALFIYWPHSWRSPIPFWPNFRRMGLIR